MQVMILGMHRSGTSMQTRLLNLAGAYFGPEGSNTGASEENPKGFWERVEARRLNDAVLFSAGADWNRVSGFDAKDVPDDALEQFHKGAQRLVLDMDAHRPWVLKEPRLCLLLPHWRKHLEVPVAVHVFRHPLEVASSLERRNGIPLGVGLVLWKFYVASAIAASRGMPAVTSFHADLIAAPHRALEGLVAALGDAGVEGLRMPSSREVEAFVSQDLYRQRLTRLQTTDRAAVAPYEELFQGLRKDGVPAKDIVVTEEELDRLRRFEATLPPFDKVATAPAKTAAQVQAEKTVAELQVALRARQNRLEATQAAVEQLSRSSDVIARELDGGRVRLEFAREEMHAALQREAEAQKEATKQRESREELEKKLQAASNEKAALRQQAEELRECARRLEQDLQQAQAGGGEVGAVREENVRLQSDYTSAAIRLEGLEAALTAQRVKLERQTHELARATRLLMRREDTIRDQARQLGELDTAYQNFRRKYATQANDLKALREEHEASGRRQQVELEELTAELAALRGSAAWRFAAPVRWLTRRVRGQQGASFRRELELVARSGLFDAAWYRSTYIDVASSGMDPAEHYLMHGAGEGRDPGPSFSTRRYLEKYSDVAASGMNPLLHFLRHGRAEGRVAK